MLIAVVGLGYVGMANLILMASKYKVIGIDINYEKIEKIEKMNKDTMQLPKNEIEKYLHLFKNNWSVTTEYECNYRKAKYIIICLPTDYNAKTRELDTSIIDKEIKIINEINKDTTIIIRSTVSIGYCNKIKKKYSNKIIFCPEFLRENYIVYDSFYPSRIVIGGEADDTPKWLEILKNTILNSDTSQVVLSDFREAEAIKLFSNTYLSMRVAFFNELDMFAEDNSLDSKKIIEGVCFDQRIGNFYNNPSFGYGGYCLPKDTQQLNSEFGHTPHKVISAIHDSNNERCNYIAKRIIDSNAKIIGIYRLIMKADSDNFRCAAITKIIDIVQKSKKKIIVYEPLLKKDKYYNIEVCDSLRKFCENSDIIIANRVTEEIKKYKDKIYTRDIYEKD